MRYELATDEQLKTIIRYDKSCPLSLLEGAVMEMLNRNLFDELIISCMKTVMNFKTVEMIYKMSVDDFLQIGRLEVYKIIEKFKSNRNASFFSFAYLNIRNRIINTLRNLQRDKRDNKNVVSLDKKVSLEEDLSFFLPSAHNVERYVMTKVLLEERIPKLTEFQKQVLTLRWKGYQFQEISEMLGRGDRNSCRKSYERALVNIREGA